ncbi:MAG: hypothetical protein DCF18_10250 [Cyanobium sp.]|uniref:ARC6/PARC6 family protein n=1 Tax=Synechococcus sp. CS-1333 TaxID=2848638 RepID=UPI000DBC200B|nr:ARC6/PARC6 family protein [Synechococcus sp. CS-1333]MCT0209450.1 ARC6/PARC6 family protein [Synechococcus sp. CS-1333]PZV22248.1 MAG: hypothetical protein DCF18_10250 [Cyanobium sp.]
MSNHNDRNIEAASQEAERLLAELETLAPATHTQAGNFAPPPPPLPYTSAQHSPAAHASRRKLKGWAWLLLIVLAGIAGTLGVVRSHFTSQSSPSNPPSKQPTHSEPREPGETSEPKAQTEPYTPSVSSEATNQEPSAEALTQEQAFSLIKGWLDAKPRVFAPPFISQAVDAYVANGPLWNDITKAGGSIDWLKENDSHYSYASNTINNITDFSRDTDEPSVTVSITQDMALHSPKGTKPTNSTDTYRYTFRQEGGNWKIWDYKKQQ